MYNPLKKTHTENLYTWNASGDNKQIRQTILRIDKRYKNGIKGVRTNPGSNIGSDHNTVFGQLVLE